MCGLIRAFKNVLEDRPLELLLSYWGIRFHRVTHAVLRIEVSERYFAGAECAR